MTDTARRPSPVRIFALAGSLRRHSYNRSLVRAAVEAAPPGVEIVTCEDIGRLPFYDGDVEEAGLPEEVVRLQAAIAGADAILVATPEYNDGTSGVLKNAIDWASRGPVRVLKGKPVAVMGASTGRGGARGGIEAVQRSMRRAGAVVVDSAVMVPTAQDAFDDRRRLIDPRLRREVGELLDELVAQVTGERPRTPAVAG